METQQLTKTAFAEMLKSAGNETYQTTFEKDVWYEQITVGEVAYRHKLISLKSLNSEQLNKKAMESKTPVLPTGLRAHNDGPVLASVFNTNTTVYYHIELSAKYNEAQAKSLVVYYAKSLLPKNVQVPSGKQELSHAA